MSSLLALAALVLMAVAAKQLPPAMAAALAAAIAAILARRCVAADTALRTADGDCRWDAPSRDQLRLMRASFDAAMRRTEFLTLMPSLATA